MDVERHFSIENIFSLESIAWNFLNDKREETISLNNLLTMSLM